MLFYSYPQITVQEVPDEISLALSISGCKIGCKNCHSKFTWDDNFGKPLDTKELEKLIQKNEYITAILFYGGEWKPKDLIQLLEVTHSYNLKTCLYTGLEKCPEELLPYLDYVKVGPYIEKLGALQSSSTNQKFYKKVNDIFVDTTRIFQNI